MTALAYAAPGEELWCLAYGTTCDAKDVAQEVASQSVSIWQAFNALFRVLGSVGNLRRDFSRLVDRQGKLIERLQAATPEVWNPADCEKMAGLLDELVAEEKSVLAHALNLSRITTAWWEGPLTRLQSQVQVLDGLLRYMDALSVPQEAMPGDDDCRDFIERLDAPDEFDFSVGHAKRKTIQQA